jgi:hypothetical protein
MSHLIIIPLVRQSCCLIFVRKLLLTEYLEAHFPVTPFAVNKNKEDHQKSGKSDREINIETPSPRGMVR